MFSWEATYIYGQSADEKSRKFGDTLILVTTRATIALTDKPLRRPMCNLTFEQYEALTKLFAGYTKDRITTSEFQTRYRLLLPKKEKAKRYSKPSCQVPYIDEVPNILDIPPQPLTLPQIDFIYYFDFKLDENGKPEIDRDHIIIFDLTQPTQGYKES